MTGALRHWEGCWWTVWQLARHRPRVIFIQNGFLLLLACALYRRMTGSWVRLLVADCHNKSLRRRLGGRLSSLFWSLKRFSFGQVDQIIISNPALSDEADRLCTRSLALIDPLPSYPTVIHQPESIDAGVPYALFVCSFDHDEPIDLIADTADRITREGACHAVVTGELPPGCSLEAKADNQHIVCPGYVDAEEYVRLLHHASVVVVLTTDADCICCGAYEAVAAGRRLVLPEHKLMESVFSENAVYAELKTSTLAEAILSILGSAEVDNKRHDSIQTRYQEEFDRLISNLNELSIRG